MLFNNERDAVDVLVKTTAVTDFLGLSALAATGTWWVVEKNLAALAVAVAAIFF